MSEVNMQRIKIDEVFEVAKNTNMKILEFKKGKKGTHVVVECQKGHKYSQRLDSFKISRGCKYCNRKVKYAYNEVKEYIESFGCTLLSQEYKIIHDKIEVECPQGHIFTPTFHNFLHQNSRCPECNGGITFDYEYVKNYINSKGCILLSEDYINIKTPLQIKCENGHIYEQTFSAFKKEISCNFCDNRTRKHAYDSVKSYIESFGFDLVSKEYINTNSILKVVCDKGHKYPVTFHNFKAGYRCPNCNFSKGEKRIMDFLDENGIEYQHPYRFCGCKHKYTLPFDFYIQCKNLCIEYDGEQHFRPVGFFGGKKKLQETQKRDNIKNEYCKENDIKLLRIPYWEFDNIEQILTDELL